MTIAPVLFIKNTGAIVIELANPCVIGERWRL